MGKVIKFKCTRCDYELEQYENVTAVYHENCKGRKKGELGVRMLPKENQK